MRFRSWVKPRHQRLRPLPDHGIADQVAIEPEILVSPEYMVEECYRLMSFAAGSAPYEERFPRLFSPKAALALRVFPEDTA